MVKRQTLHPDGWMKDSEWLPWMSACRWFCDSFDSAAAVGIHAKDDLLQNLLLPRSADKHLLVTTIQATWSVYLWLLLLSLNDCFSKILVPLNNVFISFESIKIKIQRAVYQDSCAQLLSIKFFCPDIIYNNIYQMVILQQQCQRN